MSNVMLDASLSLSATPGAFVSNILGADTSRVFVLIHNPSRSAMVGIDLLNAGVALYQPGVVMLQPLGALWLDINVGQGAIGATSDTTSSPLTVNYMDGTPNGSISWHDASSFVGPASQIYMQANSSRKACLIHNPSKTSLIAINLTGGTAALYAKESITLKPFDSILFDTQVSSNAISAVASSYNSPLTLLYC
jgi:hypothetical protein